MASIDNRSNYIVTVRNRDDLTRTFPYSKRSDAAAYFSELTGQGFKPQVQQLEDKILVRMRDKGWEPQAGRFDSLEKAEQFVRTVELERAQGLDNNYLRARGVTFVELLERYMREEGPTRLKGWEEVGKYRYAKLWRGGTGEFNAHDRKGIAAKLGVPVDALPATLQPDYPWMQKPFTAVTTVDIESYIPERIEDGVVPSTVDRELDLISAVFSVAINVWGYEVKKNPMSNVRRPKYFNERDRRFVGDEESRLLAAAQAEDRRRCIELALDALVEQLSNVDGEYSMLSATQKKRRRLQWRQQFAKQVAQECDIVPLMEVFVIFQLGTAARRGEAMNMLGEHLDFDKCAAYFPMTKNGRPRTVPLSTRVRDALERLPRSDEERVFPMTCDYLKNAWQRMLATAGIEDLHLHDLRHEAISRIAETGKFSLVDLQSISGHLDVRMLLRYSHLCSKKLANRLDEALAENEVRDTHRGRIRLGKDANLSMREVLDISLEEAVVTTPPDMSLGRVPPSVANVAQVVAVDSAARRRIA
ncbi:site-specific integrase [Eoetvoesiella caeni]